MKCGRPSCEERRLHACSGCLEEGYCSPECQKKDWKMHKTMCLLMKKGSNKLPFPEVEKAISRLKKLIELKEGTEKIRLFEYCLSFAEHQYGDRMLSKSYRERNGSRFDNWDIDICILFTLSGNLGDSYRCLANKSDSGTISRNYCGHAIRNYEKALSILEPWRKQLDSEESERTDSLNDTTVEIIYEHLAVMAQQLCECYSSLNNPEKASNYADFAISYVKRLVIGEKRSQLLSSALVIQGQNLSIQLKYKDAKDAFEEAYNVVAEQYYPDHPMVLDAANQLIHFLIEAQEYCDAERYARVAYELLTRQDPESESVGKVSQSLALVTLRLIDRNGPEGGDIVEVEMLARKALRIEEKIYGLNYFTLVPILSTLDNVLRLKGNCQKERKDVIERCLAIDILNNCIDCNNVADENYILAEINVEMSNKLPHSDARTRQECLAESYYKEAIRISTKINGPDHSRTVFFISRLALIMEFISICNS